jgi:hypothetical protein
MVVFEIQGSGVVLTLAMLRGPMGSFDGVGAAGPNKQISGKVDYGIEANATF